MDKVLDQISETDVIEYFNSWSLLKKISEEEIAGFLNDSPNFVVIKTLDADKYVDIEKSMGTEAFYDMLVKNIEEGKISLELLIGKALIKKMSPQ